MKILVTGGTGFIGSGVVLQAIRDGHQVIAGACLTIAKKLIDGTWQGGIHHFSGTPDVSWADFARAIFATARLNVTVTDITTADYPTPANSRLDCSSLARAFGIAGPDWQTALDMIIKERQP